MCFTNSNTLKFIDEDENSLIQKSTYIFRPLYVSFSWGSILFTYQIFGISWVRQFLCKHHGHLANTIILVITLYYDLLRKLLRVQG